MEPGSTAVADGVNERLEELQTVLGDAVDFAEQWPETYRGKVFELAVDRLLAATDYRKAINYESPGGITPTPSLNGGLGSVAQDLSVERDLLMRVLEIGDDGRISILGRIDARSQAELQVLYSAVYCYVKERVLSQLDTSIEELRVLCQAHGCYNGANFTKYYRASDLFREIGVKGAHSRAYRLSGRGVEEAKALLKRMVEE